MITCYDDREDQEEIFKTHVRLLKESGYFWKIQGGLLSKFGISFDDVYQESWVNYLSRKKKTDQTSRTIRRLRLLDWMRLLTHFSRKYNGPRVFIEYIPDKDHRFYVMDVETKQIIQIVRKYASKKGKLIETIMTEYLKGLSLNEIAHTVELSESRISQIVNKFVVNCQKNLSLTITLERK